MTRFVDNLANRVSTFYSIADNATFAFALTILIKRIFFSGKIWSKLFSKHISPKEYLSSIKGSCDNSHCLVSVVIPVRNGKSRGISDLINSLQIQTHSNIEYIAVDSGSTDNTIGYLESLGVLVRKINPLHFSHSYSRNVGAKSARGKYILFTVDDAVFEDANWLSLAISTLEIYEGDSYSTKQIPRNNADSYGRLLGNMLAFQQKRKKGVTISRNSSVITWLRRLVPVYTMFESISVDNTNHLVRAEVFHKIKFNSPTVEDIDYALRLTRSGGKVIYSNLTGIKHSHEYPLNNINSYYKRVLLDSRVMSQWHGQILRIKSRESYILAAWLALSILYKFLEEMITLGDSKRISLNAFFDIKDHFKFSRVLLLNSNYSDSYYIKATQTFRLVFKQDVPDIKYLSYKITVLFYKVYSRNLNYVQRFIANDYKKYIPYADAEKIIVHLWCNRIAVDLSRRENFINIEREYELDKLDMLSWK